MGHCGFSGRLQPPFAMVKGPVFPLSKWEDKRQWEKFASVKARCGRPSENNAWNVWGDNSDWFRDALPLNVPFSPSGWGMQGQGRS